MKGGGGSSEEWEEAAKRGGVAKMGREEGKIWREERRGVAARRKRDRG